MHHLYQEISHQLISWDIIDIAWILVPSYHITSHHITSNHITSHHITSHHIIIIIIIRPKPAKPRMGSQDHWPGYSQMDIAFICQHRHHRQWCNFSSRYPFLHREFKILANIGSFVANLHTFWCTFTELNYAVVPQNWQISGLTFGCSRHLALCLRRSAQIGYFWHSMWVVRVWDPLVHS